MLDIRVASSADEREAIYRLRYDIYIEEMGRKQRHADPVRRRIEEPLDERGVLLGAWDEDGSLVGTVRNNYGDCGPYHSFYQMERAGHLLDRAFISTKLMIRPQLRHRTRTVVDLAAAGYRDAVQRGMLFCFIDCNPHLLSMFRSLGFREYCGPVDHPEYGQVEPMVLGLTDRMWMERAGSPFLPWIPVEGLTPEVEAVLYRSILAPGSIRAATAA